MIFSFLDMGPKSVSILLDVFLCQLRCLCGPVKDPDMEVAGNGTDNEPGEHGPQPEHPTELGLYFLGKEAHDDVGKEGGA